MPSLPAPRFPDRGKRPAGLRTGSIAGRKTLLPGNTPPLAATHSMVIAAPSVLAPSLGTFVEKTSCRCIAGNLDAAPRRPVSLLRTTFVSSLSGQLT